MANADGMIIPLVDDDQGEGIKDFFQNLYEIEANISNTVLNDLIKKESSKSFSTEAEVISLLKNRRM